MRLVEHAREFGLMGFGLAGTVAALSCIAIEPGAALTGWLAAAVLLHSVPLGALVILAMMRLIRGRWEDDLRCCSEAASGLWSLSFLTFVPVLLGVNVIYDWPHAAPESAFQGIWLDVFSFALRTLLWFAALAVIARSQVGGRASERASALALIVLTLGSSLMAVDWLMSLDTRFHSSGFGLQVLALAMCVAYAVVLLLRLTRRPGPVHPATLGGLLMMFLLLWLYFQFMPFLVTWSGNLPAGAEWYALRAKGAWTWVLFVIGLSGAVPLLALFLPRVRRSPRALALAAACVLIGKGLEFAWLAIPGQGPVAVLSFALALCGLGCFAAAYLAPGTPWRFPRREGTA